VDYSTAVKLAPPGWRNFNLEDIARLPRAVREHEMASIPPGEPSEHVLRALFWTFVYHLEPERWDELARVEPIRRELLDALPQRIDVAVDVGAGSGRLTQHLCGRARRIVAIERSLPLCRMLNARVPDASAIAGWAQSLPLPSDCAQLTTACAAFGPDARIIGELTRVTASGGTIALISPEQPDWFEAHGWRRIIFPPTMPPPHARWIDDFFGPLDPPHEMVMIRVGG
jgi:Methyltransferase domain